MNSLVVDMSTIRGHAWQAQKYINNPSNLKTDSVYYEYINDLAGHGD